MYSIAPLVLQFRLLDMVTSPCLLEETTMAIFLVFEHIEHNLATHIAEQQKPGMTSKIIEVPIIKIFHVLFNTL